MATDKLWFVRAGESGVFANDFRTGGYVAIGWNEIGKDVPVDDTAALMKAMALAYPDKEAGTLQNWVGQVKRFYGEPQIGDGAITYDPKTRLYHLGAIDSDVEWRDQPLARTREVTWTHHVRRDDLSEPSRNSLGSIGTLFLARADVAAELWSKAKSNAGDLPPTSEGTEPSLWAAAARLAEVYGTRPAGMSKHTVQFQLAKKMREAAERLANELVPNPTWLVRSSVGKGNWVRHPWVAVLDTRVTTTPQDGAYIVIRVVSEGDARLRLGIGVGFTKLGAEAPKRAAEVRGQIRRQWLTELANAGFSETLTPELEIPGDEGFWDMAVARAIPVGIVLDDEVELNRQFGLLLGAYKDWVESCAMPEAAAKYPEQEGAHSVVRERPPTATDSVIAKPDRDWLRKQTLWTDEQLTEVLDALERTPQIILAGPPGTGKTWVAEAIAKHITDGRVSGYEVVQFHPSYSYEEFIEGLRPISTGAGLEFRSVDGLLVRIAKTLPDGLRKVLVVDEINRANLPKVFGELMYLLEYRGKRINLQYSSQFALPKDLLLIGTMNTADRSIRSIDVALRRRFEFFECAPDPDILGRFYDNNQNDVAALIDGFRKLNAELTAALDRHHTVGHTFLMSKVMTKDLLRKIWRHRLGPLIDEYFFDQPDVAANFVADRYWSGV